MIVGRNQITPGELASDPDHDGDSGGPGLTVKG